MEKTQAPRFTAFRGQRKLAAGPLGDIALAVKAALSDDPIASILVFDDQSGRVVDLDLRGSDAEILERLASAAPAKLPAGRGRPALGVVPREITLLPRQWAWLTRSSRNVSATLRSLVDEAKRREGLEPTPRQAQEAAYRFMTAMAGDQAGYEEATRALFANESGALLRHTASWPPDIRDHALKLAHPTTPSASAYLEPTQESGRNFIRRGIKGPVVMLNLLRFRPVADYSAHPHLAPSEPISGAAAFERYVTLTLPHLEASGGALTFIGEGGPFLIGPADERWDCVMLVRQASVESFLAFAENTDYLAGLAHRTAAVADARLLPLKERSAPG